MNYYTKSGYGLVKAPKGEKGDWVRAHDYDRMKRRVKRLQTCLESIHVLLSEPDGEIIIPIHDIIVHAYKRAQE